MYQKIIVLILIVIIYNKVQAQDTLSKKQHAHINYIVNIVPDNYNTTLVGSINIGKGNHKGAHISFFNWTKKNFKGFQCALINITKGNLTGFQLGIFNNNFDTLKGLQIGIFNIAKANGGAQIGIINYSDTVSSGACIGAISFVRRATYHGFEVGINEMFPFNIVYKRGLPGRYASLSFSSSIDFSKLFLGFGTGFNIPIKNKLSLNPDYKFQYSLNSSQKILSVAAKFSYKLSDKFYIALGPSFVWNFSGIKNDLSTPNYYLYDEMMSNKKNRIVIGARLIVGYTLFQKNK